MIRNGRSPTSTYLIYILRLWQEQPATTTATAVWRFSLENPTTHQRRGFAELPALVAYLQTATGITYQPQTDTERHKK